MMFVAKSAESTATRAVVSCRGIEDELHQRNKGSLLQRERDARNRDARTHRIHGLREPDFATRYAMARRVTKGAQSQKQISRELKFGREESARRDCGLSRNCSAQAQCFLLRWLYTVGRLRPRLLRPTAAN